MSERRIVRLPDQRGGVEREEDEGDHEAAVRGRGLHTLEAGGAPRSEVSSIE